MTRERKREKSIEEIRFASNKNCYHNHLIVAHPVPHKVEDWA